MRVRPLLLPLISAVLLVAAFIPELFAHKVYFNGDMLFGFYPTFVFYKQQILAHQDFLWMKNMLGGFPIYLDPSGGFYSPVHYLLFKYFSVFTAYALALMVATGLLFFVTYKAARSVAISSAGSFLAAVTYTFGYHMLTWSNNLFVVNALFSLPLLFLVLTKLSEGKWRWSIVGGLGIGFALFTGQPQWILMSFVGGGLYALYLLWLSRFSVTRKNTVLLVGFLGVVIIAGCVAAYQIIPINHFSAFSSRQGGLSWSDAQINAQTPGDMLRYIIPELNFKYFNSPEPALYIGILPLLFAILAVPRARKRGIAQFAGLLFVFGLATAFMYSPIFWFFHHLPFFNYFRGANRWMYVGTFGLALLSGIGFDAFRHAEVSQVLMSRVLKWWKTILIVILGVTAAGNAAYALFIGRVNQFLIQLFDKKYYAGTSGGLPLEHYHEVIRATTAHAFGNISLFNLRFIGPLIFLAAGYIFVRRWHQKGLPGRYLTLIILSFSVINLLPFHVNYTQIASSSILGTEPGFAVTIRQQDPAGNFRIFNLFGGEAVDQKLRTPHDGEFTNDDVVIFDRDQLIAGINGLYRVDSMDGFNNLVPRRNAALLAYIGSETTPADNRLAYASNSLEDKLKETIQRLPIFSALNIKYITSAYVLPSSPDLILISQTISTRFNIPLYLYENKNALPRLYLASSVHFMPENEQATLAFMTSGSMSKVNQPTVIECGSCSNQAGDAGSADVVNVESYRDGFVEAKVITRLGRWLILGESRLPGWHVFIDGHESATFYANGVFQGVFVPAGSHNIRFEYSRPSL